MDDAFHMCTTGSHVDLDIIWECGKKVTAATFDKNPSFNLMGRYAASQFHQLDQDGDGKLNFDEFKRGFAGFFSTVGSTLVDIFDADGNGRLFLFVRDFKVFLRTIGGTGEPRHALWLEPDLGRVLF